MDHDCCRLTVIQYYVIISSLIGIGNNPLLKRAVFAALGLRHHDKQEKVR
jgi:hypothetical protein